MRSEENQGSSEIQEIKVGTSNPKPHKFRTTGKRIRNRKKKMERNAPQRESVMRERQEEFENQCVRHANAVARGKAEPIPGKETPPPSGKQPSIFNEKDFPFTPSYQFIGDSPVVGNEEPAKPSGIPVPRVDVSHKAGMMFPPRSPKTKRVEVPESQKFISDKDEWEKRIGG